MAGFTNVIVLDKAQAKIEAVRGTPEAVMSRWLFPIHDGMSFTYAQPHDQVKEQSRIYHATREQQLGIREVRLTFEGNLTFEEVVWWLNLALDGSNLAGTQVGIETPAAYRYTLVPNGAADDLASATIKMGDGATAYKFSRCMVNRSTVRWNPDSGGDVKWRLTAELFALFEGTTTFDAPVETTRTKVTAQGTLVFVDPITGTIGTTQLTRRVRSGSVTIDNQLQENVFSENGPNADTDVSRGEQMITAELVTDHTVDTQFLDMRDNDPVKVRIRHTGAAINTATNYELDLDLGRAKYLAPTFGRAGVNRIATFGLFGEVDATVTTPLTVVATNGLATITA